MMQQMGAVLSAFMVLFYLGIGIFLIFIFDSSLSTLGRPVLVIFGAVCLFYGVYRAYTSYIKIRLILKLSEALRGILIRDLSERILK